MFARHSQAAAAELFAAHCAGADGSIEAALAELDMEHYDDEDDEDVDAARLFGGSRRPTFYASNAEDPHITLHEEDDEEELDDFTLRPTGAPRLRGPSAAASTDTGARGFTDLVLLAARTEDDVSHLEVWVYEDASGDGTEANLFVHHDLLLPGT